MNPLHDFTIDEFITGEKFQECCDIDLDWHTSEINEKKFIIPENLKDKPLIKVFAQAHYLNKFMPQISAIKDKRFVLVTQNSDGGIIKTAPRWYDYKLDGISGNIIYWFCQNCEVNNARLGPIPVAVENGYCVRKINKQEKMLPKILNPKPYNERKLAFLNGNIWTNPKERFKPYELFRGKSWVTIQAGVNGIQYFDSYIESLSNHTFVFSPDGNGSDCVRTWEALYCGCIPIVQRHVFTEYFARYLPILVVDKWEDITEDYLKYYAVNVEAKKERGEYDFNILKMSYWKDIINAFC